MVLSVECMYIEVTKALNGRNITACVEANFIHYACVSFKRHINDCVTSLCQTIRRHGGCHFTKVMSGKL